MKVYDTGLRNTDPQDLTGVFCCDICGNTTDETGELRHGRGCYSVDENGGGESYYEIEYMTPEEAEAIKRALLREPSKVVCNELPPYIPNLITVFVAAMLIMCAAGCPVPNGPGPTPGTLHVVILYESSDDNSRAQLASMYSPDVRTALDSATGTNGWRMLDKDVPLDYATDWKDMVAQAKAAQGSKALPVIVFFGHGKPQAFAFPETPAATVALIKKQRG